MNERGSLPGFVEAAMRDGAVSLRDSRGLMLISEARSLVRGASEFRKGDGHTISGHFVLESDRLWAALLSLKDADEFVREATRIQWFFQPRGRDNVAPFERYGAGILPWLMTFVRPDGRLLNVPWCVVPCFMQFVDADLFDFLWRVRSVVEESDAPGPGPYAAGEPGDVDQRHTVRNDEPVSTEADDSANGLVIEWLYEHPEVGFPCLARQSDLGDERAKRVLKSLAQCGPDEVFGHVATALGEPIARGIFERAGAPTELDEPCILVTLDAAMSNDEWPDLFSADADHAYHAMRLVAVRARTGDGWGIAFERIQGADVDSAATQPFLYGSNVVSGHREADDLPFTIYVEKEDDDNADVEGFDGVEVEGPAGSLVLKESMLKDLDLRPGLATARRVSSDKLSLMLRAYLAKHPGVFWSDAHEAASWLQLGESDEFEVIAVSDAFEHCVGPDGPAAYPELWKAKPSESAMFQSLVRAIVKRDGSLFEPGESNLDFRLHALAPLEEAEDEVDEARAAWEEDFWRW